MNEILLAVKKFFNESFNLHEDRAEEDLIKAGIRKEVNFKGSNLWTLIFAILIASVGLNVNSTAVIIGAMLISPIMGPIMGIGLGVGTNDFDLMRSGFKNLLLAAVISILSSGLYFYITPLHEVNSELLARTNPSLWDVLIAFFGGMAGIVAGTRKHSSNVVPGVAIATALMPPLCTAGFGLATGNWLYFFGALYLFFINSLFICLATFLVVKNLRFKKHAFPDRQLEVKVRRTIWIMVTLAILPSIYLAYRIVQREIFETNAKRFLQKEFVFDRTQVVSKSYKIQGDRKTIEILLVGQDLPAEEIDSLRKRMKIYKLGNAKLIVHQGLNARQEIDIAQIRASILEDVFQKQQRQDTIRPVTMPGDPQIPDISQELKVLYPGIKQYSLTHSLNVNVQTGKRDSVILFYTRFSRLPDGKSRIQLRDWVSQRIKADSMVMVVE